MGSRHGGRSAHSSGISAGILRREDNPIQPIYGVLVPASRQSRGFPGFPSIPFNFREFPGIPVIPEALFSKWEFQVTSLAEANDYFSPISKHSLALPPL